MLNLPNLKIISIRLDNKKFDNFLNYQTYFLDVEQTFSRTGLFKFKLSQIEKKKLSQIEPSTFPLVKHVLSYCATFFINYFGVCLKPFPWNPTTL